MPDVRKPLLHIDIHAYTRAPDAGFSSPPTPMAPAGAGWITPVLEANIGTALRVRVLRADRASFEQMRGADWR